MTDQARYRVSGKVDRLSTTYLCNTPKDALEAYRHLEQGGYSGITITAPDGREVTATDLSNGERIGELIS